MTNVLLHALFGLSVAALAGAGLRVASILAEEGLARALAAAVLTTAAAVIEALAFGLVGLGTSPVALGSAAVATWAIARATLPAPRVRVASELARAWRGASPGARVAIGALAGAGTAWLAWTIRYPSIGFDPSIYHYTEVALWVQNGRPGSIELMNYEFPFGNYPVTNEVLQAWGAGIARSFLPLALWPVAAGAILAAGSWLGLRSLDVPRLTAGIAVAALLSVPWLVRDLNEPLTDLPSLAWLAAAAGLLATAHRQDRPALVGPAVVAAGLAMGTKTTAIVPVLLLAGMACWSMRPGLRRAVPALSMGTLVALVSGGLWYVRNVVQHGSPSWPFVATPWGDPVPRFIEQLGTRFLDRPLATVDGRFWGYIENLGGGPLLIAAALVAPLVVRRRAVALAAGATALALVAWSVAPVTGLTPSPRVTPPGVWSLSATRYLLPVIATATLTLALAARDRGRVATPVVLAAALVWSLGQDAWLGLPYVPRWSTFALGAVVGAVVVAAVSRLPAIHPPRALGLPIAGGVAAVVAAIAISPAANGYLERFEGVQDSTAAGRDMSALLRREGAREDQRVAVVSRFLPVSLAGDHFERPLELVPREEPCTAVARRLRDGYVMITTRRFAQGVLGFEPIPASLCLRGRRPVGSLSGGSVRFLAPSPTGG